MNNQGSQQLDSLCREYNERGIKLFPLAAAFAGQQAPNDILPNEISSAYLDTVEAFYSEIQRRLYAIDTSALSGEDRISYDVLNWECSIGLENLSFRDQIALTPINQFYSLPLVIAQLAGGKSVQPFRSVKDYDDWLVRLDHYMEWCDTAIVNMRRGISSGVTIPASIAVKVVPQLESLATEAVNDHLFYAPVRDMPDSFPAVEKQRLAAAYADMIGERIIPMHKNLVRFFNTEYIPSCRKSSGVGDIPSGMDYYSHLIRLYTTTSMTANEVFDLGEREVSRITAEMEKLKQDLGFRGTLKEFFVSLRTRKELMPFDRPEQVIEHFNRIHERMKPQLKRLFDREPKTPFEVRRTEAFREASASAEYNPGSLAENRPGVFYVPIPDVKQYNILSDEDLFLHEAIPGHHYQISLTQENETLPDFRRYLWYSAYGEGWALYTESLGKELGLYTDPYQYFGMLSAEMHRAIRLVVDAGIHSKGWTREQAIQYSLEHEAESEESIIAEIERYMALPGQALSYKIGQLKIRELRSRAEEKLGERFNIADFHNEVLEAGCLPLNVLEQKIERWIRARK